MIESSAIHPCYFDAACIGDFGLNDSMSQLSLKSIITGAERNQFV